MPVSMHRVARLGLLPTVLAIAACVSGPASNRPSGLATTAKRHPPVIAQRPVSGTGLQPPVQAMASASAPAASPTASSPAVPLRVLAGRVSFDPAPLLASHLATVAAAGIRLLGENHSALIANNGGNLVSDKSLGLIANNGGGLIANNGGGLIGKLKAYRVRETGSHGQLPVAGMAVVAVDLSTSRVVAGPVSTNDRGEYQLPIADIPGANLFVVSEFVSADGSTLDLGSLSPATAAAPIQTSHTSNSVAGFILRLLPRGAQPLIDAHRLGRPTQALITNFQTGVVGQREFLAQFDTMLAAVPAAKLATIDPDGVLAQQASERCVGLMDLSLPPFTDLAAALDSIQAFDEGLASPPAVALTEQSLRLYESNPDPAHLEVARLFERLKGYGMDPNRAADLDRRVFDDVNAIFNTVARTVLTNPRAVLGDLAPLLALPPASDAPAP